MQEQLFHQPSRSFHYCLLTTFPPYWVANARYLLIIYLRCPYRYQSIHVLHQKFKDSNVLHKNFAKLYQRVIIQTLWLPIDGEIGQKVYIVVYRTETTLLSQKTGGACQGDILFSRHDSYQIMQCLFQCMYDSCTCFTYDNETCTTYGSLSTDNGISFHDIQ